MSAPETRSYSARDIFDALSSYSLRGLSYIDYNGIHVVPRLHHAVAGGTGPRNLGCRATSGGTEVNSRRGKPVLTFQV